MLNGTTTGWPSSPVLAFRFLKEFGELPERAHPTQLTGRLLSGRWRVGRLLGRGGTSSVYAATHRNGKEFAIKVLHPELAGNERARRRFLREGYIANRVGHDGVVSVLDDDVERDGTVFLVMELVEGANLEQYRLQCGGILAPEEALAVADAVLDVLAAAHAKGIVHRDVKPENIFLTQKGSLKLLDFGIASLREVSVGAAPTVTGVVLGTPGFLAPEQARGRWREVDARTDIWGLGATMFCLLTGKVVHEGETRNEAVIAAATRRAPSILSVNKSLPVELASAVDRALEPAPLDRWQSAADMRAAVQVGRICLPRCDLPILGPSGDLQTMNEPKHAGSNEQTPSVFDWYSASHPRHRSVLRRVAPYVIGFALVPLLAFVLIHRVRQRVGNDATRDPNGPLSFPSSAAPILLSSGGGMAAIQTPPPSPPPGDVTNVASNVEPLRRPRTTPPARARGVSSPLPVPSGQPAMSSSPIPLPVPHQLEDILDERN